MKPNYLMGKVIFIYIMGVLLLFLLIKDNFYSIKKIFTQKKHFSKNAFSKNNLKNFFKKNLEEKGILLMFISFTIFSFIGPALMVSLLGNKNRYEGLIVYGFYFLFFIAANKYMKVNKILIEISCVLAVLMALLTIFQLHGIDPIYSYISGTSGAFSEFGTIGNRNFLSTYLLIFQTITLGIFIFFETKRYVIYSGIIFAGILSGQTRGVWIGFLIMTIFGFFFIIKNKKHLIKMCFIIISFTLILFTLNFTSNGKILYRIESLTNDISTVSNAINLEDKSIDDKNKNTLNSIGSGRGKIWSMTTRSILKNPLIGTGPDTLHHRLIRDLNDEVLYLVLTTKTYPDKAHNEFLEYLATGGISTLIGYLTIIVSLLFNLFRKKKDAISKIFILIIISYLVQSFFNISVIQVAPIYWIMLGLATQHYRNDTGILNSENIIENKPKVKTLNI